MNGLQQVIYDISRVLLWPVLIAALLCLVWVLVELGFFLYELYLRFRYRDLDALEARTLRARKAFEEGKPRTAYRYLQQNNYSLIVARFLFDLIRNYQTQRLAAKPLKLLQEYEFYTVRRLERTRILVRIGPMLGLMGTLIPLSPALIGLATGDTTALAENLVTAFSVTVIGLLIGGIAFIISIVRDRMYSQDISDMEYLLELLEGGSGRLRSGRKRSKKGVWDTDPEIDYVIDSADVEQTLVIPAMDQVPIEPLVPVASGNGGGAAVAPQPADALPGPAAPTAQPAWQAGMQVADGAQDDLLDRGVSSTTGAAPVRAGAGAAGEASPLSFDDPTMSWHRDDDPFADLGPVDPRQPDGPAAGAGGSSGGH